ncbi:MAG: hypothetical protein ACO3C0_12835 [Burkholderiaceae bacterium]|jgi:hypothetical protein
MHCSISNIITNIRRPLLASLLATWALAALLLAPTRANAAPFHLNDGWLVFGLDKSAVKEKLASLRCEGELEAIFVRVEMPLIAINWLHPSGCTRDWMSNQHWPLTTTLRLAKQLSVSGYSQLGSQLAPSSMNVSDPSMNLSFVKQDQLLRIAVWIRCTRATCQVYASESRWQVQSSPTAQR